jgi:hypothetical protein
MKAVLLYTILLFSTTGFTIRINNTCAPATPFTGCDSIPELNRHIIEYTEAHKGKKIGRGQCWDFAAAALNEVHARWDGLYGFGERTDPKTECVYPGDIIQFEGVRVEYTTENRRWREEMSHHTAIIYKVRSDHEFDLIHQNFGPQGKKVGVTHLDLNNITKGEYTIYRPVK